MCCKSFWKKFIPFTLALVLGLTAEKFSQNEYYPSKVQEITKTSYKTVSQEGSGCGECEGSFDKSIEQKCFACKNGIYPIAESNLTKGKPSETKSIQIISKPRPNYTDIARQNEITGVVRLRVTFLASGQIGAITTVSGLSGGLTEQAIAAARNIEFKPAVINDTPITVTKQIEYSFAIY